MIDLNKKHNAYEIGQKWLGWVKDFFFAEKERTARPWRIINNHRIYFRTYFDKFADEIRELVVKYAKSNRDDYEWLCDELSSLWKQFDKVILASPEEILNNKIWKKGAKWDGGLVKKFADILIPYYEAVVKVHGYDLVNALGIKTCPYCNRHFIMTFKGIRNERPELDHFYPKADYPFFCLSVYNLIPACHSCNHEKLEDKLGVNPYSKGFHSTFMLTDKDGKKLSPSKMFKLEEKDILLDFEGADNEEKQNIKVLGLKDVYNKHTDYVKELVDDAMSYDTYAREALVTAFQGAGHHPCEVYDFVWGRHLSDAEYEDRPLSKLTKDMLDQLEIYR